VAIIVAVTTRVIIDVIAATISVDMMRIAGTRAYRKHYLASRPRALKQRIISAASNDNDIVAWR